MKKQTTLTAQSNKEVTLITALEAQLAAQTNASAIAKIQKKINTDAVAQTKFANQATTVANSASVALDNISDSETRIQSDERAESPIGQAHVAGAQSRQQADELAHLMRSQ